VHRLPTTTIPFLANRKPVVVNYGIGTCGEYPQAHKDDFKAVSVHSDFDPVFDHEYVGNIVLETANK
jgi:hypothetical protein